MEKRFKTLDGLRLGQAIYNTVYEILVKELGPQSMLDKYIADRLYFIEDDQLLREIKKYIGNRKKTV